MVSHTARALPEEKGWNQLNLERLGDWNGSRLCWEKRKYIGNRWVGCFCFTKKIQDRKKKGKTYLLCFDSLPNVVTWHLFEFCWLLRLIVLWHVLSFVWVIGLMVVVMVFVLVLLVDSFRIGSQLCWSSVLHLWRSSPVHLLIAMVDWMLDVDVKLVNDGWLDWMIN